MADFSKPTITDNYTDVLLAVRDLIAECAKFQDGTVNTNVPVGAVRFSSANKRFEKWNGTSWAELLAKATDKYDINVDRVDGYDAGNANGNIPLSNGTLNVNLNSEKLNGQTAGFYGTASAVAAAQSTANQAGADAAAANQPKTYASLTGKPQNWAAVNGNADSIGTNLNVRVGSGFYEQSSPVPANGWPISSNYLHALTCTHSNPGNNYSMQFAADFFTQRLFYRSTNNIGLQPWSEIFHTGNFDPATKANVANTVQKNGDTINEIYNTGWYRSNGNTGWQSQAYGGGFYMTDVPWLRVFGSKGLLTDWHQLHAGGNIFTSSYGWLHDRFAAATHTHPESIVGAASVVINAGLPNAYFVIRFTRKDGTTFDVRSSPEFNNTAGGGGI